MFFFKTIAFRNGEPFNLKKREERICYEILKALPGLDTFCSFFIGFSKKHRYFRDYCLGGLIGLAELITYPYLFLLPEDTWKIIGGWIAIKMNEPKIN